MPIYFDVGANDGSSMLRYADDPNSTVYAFEPTPRMIDIIKQKTAHLPNYVIVPKAVADWEGKTTFFISGQADWGCSSLNTFNDDLDKTWPGRTDFKVTDSIEVDVIRLDSFVKENNINEIDFLHVDVQGSDLEVLMGLGEYLSIVKAGVIEMPTSHERKLYKNQKYLANDAIKFLEDNGFFIDHVTANDYFNNEVNIFFQRKSAKSSG